MRKFFIFYICFCLLFSNSVFSVEEMSVDTSTQKCSGQACLSTKALATVELSTTQSDAKDKNLTKKLSNVEIPKTSKNETEQTTIKSENASEIEEKSNEKEVSVPKKENSDPATLPPVTDDIKAIENEKINDVPSEKVQPRVDPRLNLDKKSAIKNTEVENVYETENVQTVTGTRPVTTKNVKEKDIQKLSSFVDIRINEIFANPDGSDGGKEYVELFNTGDENIKLTNLYLCDKSAYAHFKNNEKHKCLSLDNVTIASQNFAIFYNKKDFTFILNNSNEDIILVTTHKDVIAKYSYKTTTDGLSWNYDADTWYEEMPTPNAPNNENPFTKTYPEIYINEILPNPISDESADEFIELYNPTDEDVNLKNWILKDSSKTGKYIFDDKIIKSKNYLTIYRADFKFALNNSGDETVSLIAPNTKIISSISYSNAKEGLSYNYDTTWYWEQPTPNAQNNENPLTKEYPKLVINELLPNPTDNEEQNEFIELYNPTDDVVELKNWILKDTSKTGKFVFTTEQIAPKSYLVIYRKDFKFALNNSGNETISLITPNAKIISSVSYNETRENMSLNRATTWYFAQMTPGTKNEPNPKNKSYPPLQLSEVLPNPIDDESTNEFIELYNPNETSVNLKYWTLKDASKTGIHTFSKDIFIAPKNYFVIYRKDFKFALNNSGETVFLIAPNEKITSEVSYKSAKENVSYNFAKDTNEWRWSKHLTPGRNNIFNNLPVITKFDTDKKVYKNVYADFSAKAKDVDGEKLKVRWDFGDGHKSYIWKTRHKYEKTGTYNVSLRIQDGSEEIVKNFIIKVKKYPKYDIEITKISPNPAGKDTGVEYIVLKNNSHKKINLQNWSIATGTSKKKLVNHPITKKLIIKSGQTKIITKKYCALTLPNKTGVIEVRRPNSSVSDKLKYGDKDISIPDNATYEKIDGTWQWIVPKDLEELKQTQEIINQALANEQILAQQKLESLVAYNAIYNSNDEANNKTSSNKTTLLDNIANYINALLNKLILALHTTQGLSTKKSNSQFPVYLPKYQNINPCDKPTIFKSKKLHFCQDKL